LTSISIPQTLLVSAVTILSATGGGGGGGSSGGSGATFVSGVTGGTLVSTTTDTFNPGADDFYFWPWLPKIRGTDVPTGADGGSGDSAFWPWPHTTDTGEQGALAPQADPLDSYWPWLGANNNDRDGAQPAAANEQAKPQAADGVFSTLDDGDTLVSYDGSDEVAQLAESLNQPAYAGNVAEPAMDAIFSGNDNADRLTAVPNGDGSTLPAAGWSGATDDGTADKSGWAWAGLLLAAGIPLERHSDKERRKRVGL
jgi:hypothetical protein